MSSWNIAALWAKLKEHFFNATRLILVASRRGGTLCFTLFVTLVVPAIPMGIDMVDDDGHFKTETCLITGVILGATFLASAERNGFRTLYGVLCLMASLLDKGQSNWAKNMSNKYAVYLLVTMAILHFTERVYWHIVQDRPFPERSSAVTNGANRQ